MMNSCFLQRPLVGCLVRSVAVLNILIFHRCQLPADRPGNSLHRCNLCINEYKKL